MKENYLQNIQQELDPAQRLNQIVENTMCIGCGICQSVAGKDAIKIEIVENGCPRPIVQNGLTHDIMNKVMDICPGTRVEGLPSWLIDTNNLHDNIWGVWREIYFSYSAEPEVRHLSSTGGLLTGLGLFLIETNQVDFILHACEPDVQPTFGERFISRSRDDVIKAAGSRYGPTPTLIDVIEVMDLAEKNNEKFAFIGTPCDVSALRNYARHDERVDRLCKYMLTMVCGGFMETDSMQNFLEKIDVGITEITSLRYRGYGCPGPTTIKTFDGRVIEKNYLDFWGEDESTWGLPPRCKICPDGIGDSADIAAADTWVGGSPTWEIQETDLGSNAAIVRTQRGVDLIADAILAGYLERGEKLSPRDMDRFQPHQVNKKKAAWARFQGLKKTGYIVPDVSGLRLQELYAENSAEMNQQQTEGTIERVKLGKFDEPTPRV